MKKKLPVKVHLSSYQEKICKTIFNTIFMVCCNIQADSAEQIFTEIYINATWGFNDKGEGFSGGGSLLVNACPYIELLEKFIVSNNTTSVVDAGCGDWEFSKYVNWNNAHYKGYDVVKHVIENNIANYANSNFKFFHGNFTDIDLPCADLLICKDVLQHLSNEEIFKFIKQFSKFKYVLITNDVDPKTLTSDNRNIMTGECRPLDLSRKPFELVGKKLLFYKDNLNCVKMVFLIDNTNNF